MTVQKKQHFNNVENQTKKKQLQKTINVNIIQLQNYLASCSLKEDTSHRKIQVHIYLLQILNHCFQHERLLLAVDYRIGAEEITLKGSRFHHCEA